ncbi:protein-tyrosine phosphatase-like protein, partial [Hyaloraphidium curvatum]
SLITHPSVPIKFLVLDCPSDALMPEYVAILKENGIQDVVRICEEKAYNKQLMEKEGIKVWDTMKFEDGGVPSDQVVADWHALVDRISAMPNPPQHGVATHCVSGIGRAPLFVAMSLIDAGLDPLDAIDVVRKRRRGAFNKRQVDWLLDGYKGRKGGGVAKKKDEPGKGGGLFGGLFGKKKAK